MYSYLYDRGVAGDESHHDARLFAEERGRLQDVGGMRGVVERDRRVVMRLDHLQPPGQRSVVDRQHRRHVEMPKYLEADVLQASVYTPR